MAHNKQFTASEVRDIAWYLDGLSRQMLRAYADLLEAREGAVPVVTRESAINAIEHVGRYNGPGRETEARQMLVEGSPSVPHRAPSDAKRLVEAVRNGLIDALRHQRRIDECGEEVGVSRQAIDEAADILSALATQENPNG